eukprot:scaffold42477_cov82-Phaeocystis_antarctica.AAC.4
MVGKLETIWKPSSAVSQPLRQTHCSRGASCGRNSSMICRGSTAQNERPWHGLAVAMCYHCVWLTEAVLWGMRSSHDPELASKILAGSGCLGHRAACCGTIKAALATGCSPRRAEVGRACRCQARRPTTP